MMKRIFPMYNRIHSAESRWRQCTFMDGSQHTIRSYKNSGFCSGMVVVWIKKSIATNGRGVRESDMPSRHFMGIVQSAYAKKTLFDSKNQDYGLWFWPDLSITEPKPYYSSVYYWKWFFQCRKHCQLGIKRARTLHIVVLQREG